MYLYTIIIQFCLKFKIMSPLKLYTLPLCHFHSSCNSTIPDTVNQNDLPIIYSERLPNMRLQVAVYLRGKLLPDTFFKRDTFE